MRKQVCDNGRARDDSMFSGLSQKGGGEGGGRVEAPTWGA